jgi:hypothetical protein
MRAWALEFFSVKTTAASSFRQPLSLVFQVVNSSHGRAIIDGYSALSSLGNSLALMMGTEANEMIHHHRDTPTVAKEQPMCRDDVRLFSG